MSEAEQVGDSVFHALEMLDRDWYEVTVVAKDDKPTRQKTRAFMISNCIQIAEWLKRLDELDA